VLAVFSRMFSVRSLRNTILHCSYFLTLLIAASLTLFSHAQKPLVELKNCTYVPTDWNDGDSFRIKDEAGNEMTVRLYGADCLETKNDKDSDAQRLLEQRRYFGISEKPPGFAMDWGKQATKITATALAAKFTIITSYADARGDAKFSRVYAFIKTNSGDDLSELLVKKGYARAYGVYRVSIDGVSQDELRDRMKDLELLALQNKQGIWGDTNWQKLPEERKERRKEIADLEEAKGNLPALAGGEKLDINSAARDELMSIKGVGEVMANRIIEARPFSKIEDLHQVYGIGDVTYKKLLEILEVKKK
jgi:competence protein ComEA